MNASDERKTVKHFHPFHSFQLPKQKQSIVIRRVKNENFNIQKIYGGEKVNLLKGSTERKHEKSIEIHI